MGRFLVGLAAASPFYFAFFGIMDRVYGGEGIAALGVLLLVLLGDSVRESASSWWEKRHG